MYDKFKRPDRCSTSIWSQETLMKFAIVALFIMLCLLTGLQVGAVTHIRTLEKQMGVLSEHVLLNGKMSAKIDEYNAKVKEHNQKMLKY